MLRLSLILTLAATMPLLAGEPVGIESSAFLPEGGLNRDNRVLQYNSFVGSRAAALEITAEWMLRSPMHQMSCTLPIYDDAGRGFGDATIDYRRQVHRGTRSAVATRLSLVLPTRSARFGSPVTGLEIAVPVTFAPSDVLSVHAAAVTRWLTSGEQEVGGQAAVALVLNEHAAVIVDSAWTPGETVVRPGVQFSFELGGLRVSPVVAMAMGSARSSEAMLLVGIEHDF